MSTPENLAPRAQSLITDADNQVFLSAASSREIAIKYGMGKLPLPIQNTHALHAASFPPSQESF